MLKNIRELYYEPAYGQTIYVFSMLELIVWSVGIL